ncbi:hypothetical protein ACOMICROBIO_GDFFDHBD_02651 [Vibrio sp. B1REV9]|uniref:hypothetical protein n=1 Tax=Vibrio TaxID=662 RepID=UPI001AFB9C35|nr:MULTISPECIES: hypothetical protein [Vibrio]BBM66277.1 hypothetical protein VA249_29230 [Vibrio alfacsensis]CAE6931820.1 hypothetical protein ACOMICROBIO_GDFFDHBD_02651 [Vibrio sp. B1REV9]
MQTSPLEALFLKASLVYSYGDHITGDILLSQCSLLIAKLFEVDEQKHFVLEVLSRVGEARKNDDFTHIADILRYEIVPILNTAH